MIRNENVRKAREKEKVREKYDQNFEINIFSHIFFIEKTKLNLFIEIKFAEATNNAIKELIRFVDQFYINLLQSGDITKASVEGKNAMTLPIPLFSFFRSFYFVMAIEFSLMHGKYQNIPHFYF